MDGLELLKKQWKREDDDLPNLSYDEIYKMLLKKSSSIVKWIFVISVAEILFWTCLAFLVPESSHKFNSDIGLGDFMFCANIMYYAVFVIFIYLFYKNYRKISTTDNVKELLENILRTRKTVKYFIIYNIVGASIMIVAINIYYYLNQDLTFQLMSKDYGTPSGMSKEQFMNIFFLMQLLFGVLMLGAILLFYRIVYGILLRRLHRNYKELKKIEA